MRCMGLDVGDRRIGVALSDESGLVAFPLAVINRSSGAEDMRQIAALVEEHRVELVVVGLPLTLTGGVGPQAQKVQGFLEQLKSVLTVPVVTWDERLTTAEVERLLIKAEVRRRRRREVVDKLAAAVLLDAYLRSKSERGT
jgi:putative Holliday junction resolvase